MGMNKGRRKHHRLKIDQLSGARVHDERLRLSREARPGNCAVCSTPLAGMSKRPVCDDCRKQHPWED